MSEQFILKDVEIDGNRMNGKKFVHKSMGFGSVFSNLWILIQTLLRKNINDLHPLFIVLDNSLSFHLGFHLPFDFGLDGKKEG